MGNTLKTPIDKQIRYHMEDIHTTIHVVESIKKEKFDLWKEFYETKRKAHTVFSLWDVSEHHYL